VVVSEPNSDVARIEQIRGHLAGTDLFFAALFGGYLGNKVHLFDDNVWKIAWFSVMTFYCVIIMNLSKGFAVNRRGVISYASKPPKRWYYAILLLVVFILMYIAYYMTYSLFGSNVLPAIYFSWIACNIFAPQFAK
jgi:magnesium-transporting ATPase (P-type)